MAASSRAHQRPGAVLVLSALAFLLSPTPSAASTPILPWEVAVAEIEAGRLRGLAEGLAKRIVEGEAMCGEDRVLSADDVTTIARDAGVNDFIAKPVSADSLHKRLARLVENPQEFVENDAYFGPDRRRRDLDTSKDRRSED